jgi:hypothetical protein
MPGLELILDRSGKTDFCISELRRIDLEQEIGQVIKKGVYATISKESSNIELAVSLRRKGLQDSSS